MKMNSIKIFLFTLIVCCLLGSCKKFLEPSGDNQYTIDRVLNEPGFAEGVLTAGYTALPTEYNWSETATDDAVSNIRSNAYLRMATGEWSSKFNPFDNWAVSYGAIYNMNLFLTVVDKVKWNTENPTKHALIVRKYKNEALALRAYHYMQLLSRFGGEATGSQLLGVPLITEPIGSTGNWKVQRATFAAVVQQINTDLDQAIANLPYDYVDVAGETDWNQVFGVQNKNRISGRIAKALKSKLALLVASPAFNGGSYDQAKADAAASQAAALITELGGVAAFPTDRIFWDADADITNTDILWRNNHFTNNTREAANYPPSLFGMAASILHRIL
jgi:starch-binding outer membrane protein, SusD/RagB family